MTIKHEGNSALKITVSPSFHFVPKKQYLVYFLHRLCIFLTLRSLSLYRVDLTVFMLYWYEHEHLHLTLDIAIDGDINKKSESFMALEKEN